MVWEEGETGQNFTSHLGRRLFTKEVAWEACLCLSEHKGKYLLDKGSAGGRANHFQD